MDKSYKDFMKFINCLKNHKPKTWKWGKVKIPKDMVITVGSGGSANINGKDSEERLKEEMRLHEESKGQKEEQ